MNQIKFVHLLNDFSGSPKVLSQVISGLQSSKFEIELFTSKNTKGFLTDIAKTSTFNYRHFNYKWLTFIVFMYSQLVLFIKLLKFWRKDVIIYVNTMLPFGAALAGFVMRKPVIYHIHEISLTPKILKQFLRVIIQLTASKIIFVSKALKQSESFKRKKEYVVYNALSFSLIHKALGHNLVVKKESFNVLMLASLKNYKGLGEFIEIARLLDSCNNVSFTLVINAAQRDINVYFKNKSLPENVEIFSSQSDVAPFYKKASLVMNLSHVDVWVETFGLTILEAMAFGIPVIVPPVGGPTEIVSDGIEGYLISSYETNSIAEKIKTLSLDKVEWLRLAKNALIRSKEFDEEIFNKQLIDILNA